MKDSYIKHLTTLKISALCFRALMLIILKPTTQAEVAKELEKDTAQIKRIFDTLKDNNLIEIELIQGKNKFYKAITDERRLRINIPGQTKLY